MTMLKQRTAGAALWSAIEISARYGVQIVVTIVLARLLTPADFGLIAMLLVFTNIGALFIDAGFSTALIQKASVSKNDETTVFWFSNGVSLIAACMLYFSAPFIADFYRQPDLEALTRLIAWVLPLSALGAVPDALLSKRMNFRARAQTQAIASLISGAIAIMMALRGFGVLALVAQALIASGLRSLLLLVSARWHPSGRFEIASFRTLFGFGGYMLVAGVLNAAFTRLHSLLIGRLFDASSLGFYTLAQNASQAPTSLIGGVLSRVGLPVFSTMSDRPEKLREALRLSIQVSMFVFFPCMVGIALIAEPAIQMIYGAQWIPAAPMLSFLALAGAVWPVHVLNVSALSAQGRSDKILQLELYKDIVGIIFLVAASRYGPLAIAGSALASSLCSAAINAWYSGRMLNYGFFAQLLDQKIVFFLSALAAIPAWCILHWMPLGIGPTIAAVTVAGGVYIGGAALLRYSAWVTLQEIIRNYLKNDRKP